MHSDVLSRRLYLAYAAEAFFEVADEFLVADDEDHVAGYAPSWLPNRSHDDEDAGLIERSRDRSDRRRAIIVLSKGGERLLSRPGTSRHR